MIQYSHVCLAIPCWTERPDVLSEHLGVVPTRILKEVTYQRPDNKTMEEVILSTWVLDSPSAIDASDIAGRLWGLANVIAPFAERLLRLPTRYRRWIDILYCSTPSDQCTFAERFRVPASLLQQFGAWHLDLACEITSDRRPNQADAANRALASRFHAAGYWRAAADPHRSRSPMCE